MIPTDALKRLKTSEFNNNDLIQFCSCGWQTPEPQQALARCPECSASPQAVRFDKEFRERVGKPKLGAWKEVKPPEAVDSDVKVTASEKAAIQLRDAETLRYIPPKVAEKPQPLAEKPSIREPALKAPPKKKAAPKAKPAPKPPSKKVAAKKVVKKKAAKKAK